MPLDVRQSFKAGFLLRCAEEGLTPEETKGRIDQAFTKLADLPNVSPSGAASAIYGGGKAVLGDSLQLGLAGIAGAGLIGSGLGWGAAKMSEPDVDPEEVKTREMIAQLQYYTDSARRKSQQRMIRGGSAQPTGPSLRF